MSRVLQSVPFAFAASHRHDHRVVLNDFSVSFRSSPCTSLSLNRACRIEVVESLNSPQIVLQWFNPCHSILKTEIDVRNSRNCGLSTIPVESSLCIPFILAAPSNAFPIMFLRLKLSLVVADFISLQRNSSGARKPLPHENLTG